MNKKIQKVRMLQGKYRIGMDFMMLDQPILFSKALKEISTYPIA